MPILYAKSIHVKTKKREREIENLYWQKSAEEHILIYNISIYYTVSGCSHFKAAWVDMFEISHPALKILPNYSFPGCGSWRDLRTASTEPLSTEGLTEGIIFISISAR